MKLVFDACGHGSHTSVEAVEFVAVDDDEEEDGEVGDGYDPFGALLVALLAGAVKVGMNL